MLTAIGMFAMLILRGTATGSFTVAFLQSVMGFLCFDGVDNSSGALYVLSPSLNRSCFLFLLRVLGAAACLSFLNSVCYG